MLSPFCYGARCPVLNCFAARFSRLRRYSLLAAAGPIFQPFSPLIRAISFKISSKLALMPVKKKAAHTFPKNVGLRDRSENSAPLARGFVEAARILCGHLLERLSPTGAVATILHPGKGGRPLMLESST